MTHNDQTSKAFRLAAGLLLSVMTAWLGYVMLGLESEPAGLGELVEANLEASGVSNRVTAVLINFRGYDTLLEMGVLLVAVLGAWSLGGIPRQPELSVEPILSHLPGVLVPLLILVSGYLLWSGAHAPGGAFQAGALLGAAGVLLLLSGWQIDPKFIGLPLRVLLMLGLGLFVSVATLPLLVGGVFLQYPQSLAGQAILLIEAAATLSIGVTLAVLFMGGLPGPRQR